MLTLTTHRSVRAMRSIRSILLLSILTLHLIGCDDDATQSASNDTSTPPGDTSTTLGDTSTTLGDTSTTLGDTSTTLGDTSTPPGDTDASTEGDADTAEDTSTPPTAWWTPTCDRISGTNAITLSRDEGATLATLNAPLSGITYLWGVSALPGRPGHMVALQDQRLLFSTDAGCTWTNGPTLEIDSSVSRITPTSGDIAYVWADNGTAIHRVNVVAQAVEWSGFTPATIKGVGVDDKDGGRVAFGDDLGRLQISLTGGESWERGNGNPAASGGSALGYRVFFDPNDIDHAVYGQASGGASVTFDGGDTWTRATGLSYRGDGNVNAFELVISPANPQIVWAAGLDIAELDETTNSARHIYRSTDGGATFAVAFTASATTTIINGPVMAAHPTDDAIFYWIFGTYYQGYGTDIYRYDATARAMTFTHNSNDDISSIAFNPADAGVMYFGLVSEDIH